MIEPLAALRPFVAPPRAAPGERCELCARPIEEPHAHVVNLETRRLLCACGPCRLLFTQQGAGAGKYKAVPERYWTDPSIRLDEATWERLQIPVRMAFFFFNSTLGRCVAFYPGPAGVTESLLGLDAWNGLVADHPALATLEPDVEALLVYGGRGQTGFRCYVVPIHACYELAGRVRQKWKGLGGGEEAMQTVADFFAEVERRCG